MVRGQETRQAREARSSARRGVRWEEGGEAGREWGSSTSSGPLGPRAEGGNAVGPVAMARASVVEGSGDPLHGGPVRYPCGARPRLSPVAEARTRGGGGAESCARIEASAVSTRRAPTARSPEALGPGGMLGVGGNRGAPEAVLSGGSGEGRLGGSGVAAHSWANAGVRTVLRLLTRTVPRRGLTPTRCRRGLDVGACTVVNVSGTVGDSPRQSTAPLQAAGSRPPR